MTTGTATHIALMGYRLPQLIGLQYRFDTPKDETRDYEDIELQPNEFVADGEDGLGLIFYVRSLTDDEPEKAAEGIDLLEIKLAPGSEAEKLYEIARDPDFKEPGQLRYTIRAKTPLLYTRTLSLPLTFKATGAWRPAAEKRRDPTRETIDVTVQPCPLFLKHWVIPGKRRGTSDAGAFAGVRLPRDPGFAPLGGLDLELAVAGGSGGPSLAVQDAAVRAADENGEVHWTLAYSGLTFDNIGGAEFRVRCRIASSEQATVFPISVGRNLLEFLSAVERDHVSLDLTNPEFVHRSTAGKIADWFWPDGTLGVLYNFRSWVAGIVGYAAPPEWNHYVCGQLARRLLSWAMERRCGTGRGSFDTARQMNGIELGEYTFNELHDFFGFNLSGNDPWAEAKFIDPWWNQAYDGSVLLSLTEERVKLAGALTFLTTVAVTIAYFLGAQLVKVAMRYAPSIVQLFRRFVMEKLLGEKMNPKHTIGVFGGLAVGFAALFRALLYRDPNMFEDEGLLAYRQYPAAWLQDQAEAFRRGHANGLPPVDPVENW